MPVCPLSPSKRGAIYGMSLYMSQRKVAEHFGVSQSIVSYIKKKQRTLGTQRNAERLGRPSGLDDRDLRRISRVLDEFKWESLSHVATVICHMGIPMSVSTLRRLLKKLGLKRCVAIQKPLLSARSIALRLQYARQHAFFNWRKVIFTDECSVNMDLTQRLYVTRPLGAGLHPDYVAPRKRSGVPSVMVWGAIWHGGRSKLIRFDTSQSLGKRKGVTASIYLQQITTGPLIQAFRRLKARWRGYGDVWVVEDNAPVHTAAVARRKAEDLGLQFLPHPPSSPDLNCIEHVWALLKRKLYLHYPRPTTQDQVFEVFEKLWNELDQEIINKLVDSMGDRMEACETAKGFHTKY